MPPTPSTLPQIPFGPHRLSRFVLGANCICGGSHLSRFLNAHMKRYFAPEQIDSLFARCQAEGVNTWQSGAYSLPDLARFRASGGQMQFIAIAHPGEGDDVIERLAAAGTLGIAYHGEETDVLFKRGELDRIVPFLQRIRDAGLQVGVSTHMPAVVDYVESKGWDVDYYMTCVYERHRTREELQALLGHVPIPVPEVYLEDDPPRMFAAMRQTARTCLAFKILAAGRLCEKQETVEQAFKDALAQIKPIDGLIVGLYPEFEDQVGLDAGYVRQYNGLSG